MVTTQKFSKTINIFLWIAQVILSLALIWSAATKLFQSEDVLAKMWPWTINN